MTAPIAVQGVYADLRLIKTRSVASISIEIPIERAEDFVTAFGLPIPGSERPVALALLNTDPGGGRKDDRGSEQPSSAESGQGPQVLQSSTPKAGCAGSIPATPHSPQDPPRRRWSDLSASQQAGIRCAEKEFQGWLWNEGDTRYDYEKPADDDADGWADLAAIIVRQKCHVCTRRELDKDDLARARWHAIDVAYEQAVGKLAKDYRA